MKHIDLIKRAFHLTWRYRPLWIFGFLLALCSGGSGGGSGRFNFPGGSQGNFGNIPHLPDITPTTIIIIIVAIIALVILLVVLGIVVRTVTRTALIGMVGQVEEKGAVRAADGWRLGWSGEAWRLFLVNLLIGLPLAIFSLLLLLTALSPLLLLLTSNNALKITGIVLTVLAVLAVILILIVVGVIITPIQELTWRRTVLDRQRVIQSLRDAVGLIKRRFKDIAVLWLLMFGIGLGWGLIALIVVLPVSLVAALLIGGIPAGLVYLLSQSGWGAAITGIPLGLLAFILISSFAAGLYLVFQSTVWTLAYLEVRQPGVSSGDQATESNNQKQEDLPAPDPGLSS
jgi:hypothetical protein